MKDADVGVYLLHIADSCAKILRYIQDVEYSDFTQNEMVQDAVLRNFEIIGEAAKHVPKRIGIGTRKSCGVEWPVCETF